MADIGVIGGSGFYSFLQDARPVTVETPFGPPSEAPVVGEVSGRHVAFIPRLPVGQHTLHTHFEIGGGEADFDTMITVTR